eukprot:CAMPEP_0197600972 /NCGR_PEP_ID=MMETSP1326-20131121/34388_1 /TAXON_ID=1155430 /ORGANISM="Genus nov. species nov., Strain RCC2288" /LENGTH=199 /DNA_ID=CAMNT_0043168131 /DNA_START=35 /DNA_END=634 /DNA_ORIENTATION=+
MAMSRFTLLLVCGLALAAGTFASRPLAESDVLELKADTPASAPESAPEYAESPESAPENTIPGTLVGYDGDIFSTLVAAATAADLVTALDGDGPYTVFAPTNEAFAGYLAENSLTAEDVLASPELKNILLSHVVASKFTAKDVLGLDLPTDVETLSGAKVKVELKDGKLLVAGNEVTLADIMAANGVIHGIDGVITDTK